MKRIVLTLAITTAILFACTDRDDDLLNANIRIRNNTSLQFDLVEVIADSIFYENVASNGFSQYLPYETAFREMPFTVATDSTTLSFTPAEEDTVPLPVGLYTYEVSIDADGQLQLNFRVD